MYTYTITKIYINISECDSMTNHYKAACNMYKLFRQLTSKMKYLKKLPIPSLCK